MRYLSSSLRAAILVLYTRCSPSLFKMLSKELAGIGIAHIHLPWQKMPQILMYHDRMEMRFRANIWTEDSV